MSIAARVLELAWTTGVIYVLSRLFVARARIEIVSYSRKNSYPPPPTVDATRCVKTTFAALGQLSPALLVKHSSEEFDPGFVLRGIVGEVQAWVIQ